MWLLQGAGGDAMTDAVDIIEETEVVEEEEPTTSPYDLEGGWYVIHSYSGYENKVKANLETRIRSMHMEDRIFEVVIPLEPVVEFKGPEGHRKKKVFQATSWSGWCSTTTPGTRCATPGSPGSLAAGASHPRCPDARWSASSGWRRRKSRRSPATSRSGRSGRPFGWSPGVRRLQRGHREHQRRPVQGRGAGQHLRARHPGGARVRGHHQAMKY